MCTRYALEKDLPEMKEITDNVLKSPLVMKFLATYAKPLITDGEVRPTDIVPVIAPDSRASGSVFPMQWGFLGRDNRRTIFNARLETAAERPTFKEAWKSHRCIVPASCYYEWEHLKSPDGRVKTGGRYIIQPAGSTMTWLGGLYRIENGFPVFVVLTREPTPELESIHDRMPFMLPENKINEWIDPASDPEEVARHALSDMVILPFAEK